MPTERKIQLVAEIEELISDVEIAIATSYQGASMSEQTELRTALREAGVTMRVVKNSLLRRAAANVGLEQFAELIDGPTALVVGKDEPVTAARVLHNYIRDHPNTSVAIRNAVIGGEIFDSAYVGELALVPPRDELLARIAGGLIGKIVELAGLLQATTREFAGLIEARANQLEEAGAG